MNFHLKYNLFLAYIRLDYRHSSLIILTSNMLFCIIAIVQLFYLWASLLYYWLHTIGLDRLYCSRLDLILFFVAYNYPIFFNFAALDKKYLRKIFYL